MLDPTHAAAPASPATPNLPVLRRFLVYLGEELVAEGCQLSNGVMVGQLIRFWYAWATSYVQFIRPDWDHLENMILAEQFVHNQRHRGEPRLVWLD